MKNMNFSCIFSTKGMNWGPKATISTCSQVVSIMLSGELSDSIDSHPFILFLLLKALRLLFKCIYLLWEYVGGPEKDQVFCYRPGNL